MQKMNANFQAYADNLFHMQQYFCKFAAKWFWQIFGKASLSFHLAVSDNAAVHPLFSFLLLLF